VRTLVVGLGNPILGDDGVGWVVAEEVNKKLASSPARPLEIEGSIIDVDCLSLGGISLMEHLIGYKYAVLIDAFICDGEDGSIIVSKLDDLPSYSAFHLTSAHDMSVHNALRLGRQLGAELPEDVTLVGISARHVYDFSEELSPPVQDAIPKATQIVMEILAQKITMH